MLYNDFYNPTNLKKSTEAFGVENIFAIPRIMKVVLNVGAGESVVNKNVTTEIAKQITLIAGQKAVITKARRSVSAFKIREGLAIGVKVTLRGKKKVDFVNKLIHVVIPLLKDFRGIKHSAVDQSGNLNIGFTEQTIFPEIDFDAVDKIRGLQVTVTTNAKSHDKGKKLFELLGIPFEKK
ncbi:MAG: 50S ribosomal protein L5 [Candidatus Roizmanbacteria bacterium]